MRRMFFLLAAMACGLGLLLLLGPDGPSPDAGTQALQKAPAASVAYSGWAAGLCMGLCLAWLAGVDWAGLPARVFVWLGLQGRRVMLMTVAGLLVGILLYF